MPLHPSEQEEEQNRPNGFPLLAFSIGTFGTGLFIASRQYKKEKLNDLPPTAVRLPPKVQPVLFALKALGTATVIVGVVATCAVKTTMWYMDVHNVNEFQARMKTKFGGAVSKNGFDGNETADSEWNQAFDDSSKERQNSGTR